MPRSPCSYPQVLEAAHAREVSGISNLRRLADWPDTRFVIPGTGVRFDLVRAHALGAPKLLLNWLERRQRGHCS